VHASEALGAIPAEFTPWRSTGASSAYSRRWIWN